jgi:hypothetical protein
MNEAEIFEALEGNFDFDRANQKSDEYSRLAGFSNSVLSNQEDAAIARCVLVGQLVLVMLGRIGQKPYLAASHASCRAQRLATIGSTAGTAAGVAGRM